ncbi:MAG: transposase [Candidatus Omnitrophica bacterium]|nr:transposase [Candidatus Omnitrophota bacterium]
MRGKTIYVANRFFPNSKTCSKCKELRQDLRLKDRIFKCRCGNNSNARFGFSDSSNPYR